MRWLEDLTPEGRASLLAALPALEELGRGGAALIRAWASSTFSALEAPNFRRYLSGQAVSLIGTWMQTVALGWLVLR